MFLPAPALAVQAPVSQTTIVLSPGATPAERYAAEELSRWLGKMTGAKIPVKVDAADAPENAIVVGQGALARRLFPSAKPDGLEDAIVQTSGSRTLVSGGRPRGTVYAAHRLLARLGCRWWTPWASSIPKKPNLSLNLNFHERPAFEYRDPYWYPALSNADWAAQHGANGFLDQIDERHGGRVEYAEGFVHTFNGLVPPDPYFRLHPEWFSLIDGKRTATNAQLCTTDPELRAFVLKRVKEQLRAHPRATIVSVSQNDCFNPCQCERCQALAQAEGSEAGPMVALANYVAEGIEREHPGVAVDTLAYQYSRHAPKTIRPRPNVIVRLCSIECNFGQPLTHPSNAAFATDIREWSRLTDRLYVWNYNTNFARYVQPQPNYFNLGPNLRFFRANGVRGVFEQGAYQSNGSEMTELRAWVQAQLLWDPSQDDKALIDEFLKGYFGPAAAPIRRYLELMSNAAKDHHVGVFDPPMAGYLDYDTMRKAENLWQEAERVTKGDERWRVRQGHLAVRYVWLNRWNDFRAKARNAGHVWPMSTSRRSVAADWLAVATGPGPQGWSPMTAVDEGRLSPQAWVAQFANDPAEPAPLPARRAVAPRPGETDLQDDQARLANEPDWATLRADPLASDGIACWMPGTHHEWAFQLPLKTTGRYRVLVVARVDRSAVPGAAFSAGLYDDASRQALVTHTFETKDLGAGYKSFDLGTFELAPTTYVWVAPPGRAEVQGVWVDRVVLVKP